MINVFLGKMIKTMKQNKAICESEDNIDKDLKYQQSATIDGNSLLLFFL